MLRNAFNPAGSDYGFVYSNRNRITFSGFTEFGMVAYAAPTCSIKYVLQGTEHYQLSGKRFPVTQGNFLLVNGHQPSDVFIQSKKEVLGFCIHLEQSMLNEVYAQATNDAGSLLDDPGKQAGLPEFEALIYSDKESSLGEYLQHLARHFDKSTSAILLDEQEVFYNLAERLIALQQTGKPSKGALNIVRSSTRQELLRRLAIAKEMMDAQGGEMPGIEAIAKEAMLSGSHFFRSFKKVYGLSPYQYLLKRKMAHAAQLIAAKKMTATEIAFSCGYPDLASFSKAFKKIHGLSPNKFFR